MTVEQEQYYPDSLGDLFGRVTELLGFEANLDEHKVQWLSVAGDDRYQDLFLEMLCPSDTGPRLNRSFFSTERLKHGGFGSRFYERLGIEGRRPDSRAVAAPCGRRHPGAVEAAVLRMAGQGAILCLAGGLGLNALLVSALENHSGYENVFVQPASGNAGTAMGAVLETWHSVYRQSKRVCHGHALPRPLVYRRGNQAGAGELQAALPLPADHRRGDRHGGGAFERQQDSSPGCTAAWSSAHARWATAAFWRRRSTPIPRRTSTRSSSTASRSANSPRPCRRS